MLAFVNKNTSKILCKVDGKSLQASFGESLLQACFKAYIDIPRFCYHEGLQIAGNCRMCLVEVENSRKLVASCATPVVTKLSVYTKTFRVKKARQAVLEFLLINHPLDCPICDQGGECDLQDITLVFGSDRGRFYEMSKRAVVDKNLGPLIKTIMNRCIHCTRCVRFFKEVSLESDFSLLGLLGRGSSTEIGTYVLDDLLHELSGNVIDLCPVGALTSKPFAFKARTWELTSQYNFDVVDVMMPRVKMDLSGSQVLRILPYMEEYGYGWVSNKTRFFFDALNLKRLDQCLWSYDAVFTKICKALNLDRSLIRFSLFLKITWRDAFFIFFNLMLSYFKRKINFILPPMLSLNQAWALKKISLSLGVCSFVSDALVPVFVDFRNFYTIDVSLDCLEDWLWVLVCVGVNLRMEAPLLFLHLKRLYGLGRIVLFSALNTVFFDKKVNNVGITLSKFLAFLEGRISYTRVFLKKLFFYKFLFLTNVEYISMSWFHSLKLIFSKMFLNLENSIKRTLVPSMNVNFVSLSFGVLQRYVGNISAGEFAFVSRSTPYDLTLSHKGPSVLNVCVDVAESAQSVIGSTDLNILFAQSAYINEIFKRTTSSFSLIIPYKSIYVNEEESFFDAFLRQKSVINVKPASLDEKSLEEIFNTFSLYVVKMSTISVFKLVTQLVQYSWQEGLGVNCSSSGCSFLLKAGRFEMKPVFCYHLVLTLSFIKWVGMTSLLNFYEDKKLNLVNFSRILKRSSLAFQKTRKFYSFGLFLS